MQEALSNVPQSQTCMHGDNFAIDMSYVTFFSLSTCVIEYQQLSYHPIMQSRADEHSLTPMLACPTKETDFSFLICSPFLTAVTAAPPPATAAARRGRSRYLALSRSL